MIMLKKKLEKHHTKKYLLDCLKHFWINSYYPTLKDLKNKSRFNNNKLLIKLLRHLRTNRILDGDYDEQGIYRLFPYKIDSSETSKNFFIENISEKSQ